MWRFSYVVLFSLLLGNVPGIASSAGPAPQAAPESAPSALPWQSPARLLHLITKTSGTLMITDHGVEFRSNKGSLMQWSYIQIQSFRLVAHHLDLKTYQNRSWHFPGDRTFHFKLKDTVPPITAEAFARKVQKPVENARPDPSAPAFATLAARHRTFGGGTNGVLRFRKQGIDYVTSKERGSRSWRWSDIQTIANPDPYHFRVQGYRETFEFELKESMSRKLFDRLWDEVYGRGLTGLAYSEGRQQ